jgi:hypothetical protein
MNHKVLVIGGGNPNLYNDEHFFEVGNHPTSNYGVGLDWSKIEFWHDLNILLADHKFLTVMFDIGSESWLYNLTDDVFNYMMYLILTHTYEDGIVIVEGRRVRSSRIQLFSRLIDIGFNNIGLVRFGPIINDDIFNILSLVTGDIIDKTNIFPPDIAIGEWDPRGFIIQPPELKSVSEQNQIEFIKNRIIN